MKPSTFPTEGPDLHIELDDSKETNFQVLMIALNFLYGKYTGKINICTNRNISPVYCVMCMKVGIRIVAWAMSQDVVG
jgi:hypothetical protein